MCQFLDYVINFSVPHVCGRFACHLFENFQEIVVIRKAHLLRDLIDLQCRIVQQLPCFLNAQGIHIVREGAPGFLPENLTQIRGVHVAIRCHLPQLIRILTEEFFFHNRQLHCKINRKALYFLIKIGIFAVCSLVAQGSLCATGRTAILLTY